MSYYSGSLLSVHWMSSEPRFDYTKNITVIVLHSLRRDLEPALQRRKLRLREVNLLTKGGRADWLLYEDFHTVTNQAKTFLIQ